jgi:hypothetical protein
MSPLRTGERLLRRPISKPRRRGAALEADDQNRRLNGEWSVIESLRYLVLVVDP